MADRRNILLVIADDMGKAMGCYGDKAIRTPCLDSLAAEGVLFSNAFTSTASCSGSRSVIYTGLHTHENGMYGLHHDHHHFMTFENVETAPRLLRDHGYHTGIVGKIHVGPPSVYPWEHVVESPSRDVNWVADQARWFLRKAQTDGRPFFLTVGYMDPHRDSTRGGFGNRDNAVSGEDAVYSPEAVTVPDFLPDLPAVRQELAEYYRSIARVDRGFGLVMKALRDCGFDDTTLVIFLSDNGPPFLNSKTTLYDAGVRLPLIVRQPNGPNGLKNPNLVSYVDILPTVLDWARFPGRTPKENSPRRRGRSILPVLGCNTVQGEWTQVFGSHTFHEVTNYYPTRFIRTERYKYHRNVAWQLQFPFSADLYSSLSWEEIRNGVSATDHEGVKIGHRSLQSYIHRPPEELYDMYGDPREVVNLAGSHQHEDLLRSLRKEMEQWQRDTKDPWLIRDGVSVRAIQEHLDGGMQVPDRFDFDVSKPGSRAV